MYYKFRFIIFLLLSLFIFSCSYSDKEERGLKTEKEKLDLFLEGKYEYMKKLAKIIASDQKYVDIYKKINEKSNNIQDIKSNKEIYLFYGNLLKDEFIKNIGGYERDINIPLKYAFYLPDTIMWLRPDMPAGEDIVLLNFSESRLDVSEALKKNTFISGYYINEGELRYSAIAPILNEKGEVLGGFEAWTEYSLLLSQYLQQAPNIKLILFILDDFRKDFEKTSKEGLILLNKGILYFSNISFDKEDYNKLYLECLKNEKIVQYKNYTFFVDTLYDSLNRKIALLLLAKM